jgi:hypothetical protein
MAQTVNQQPRDGAIPADQSHASEQENDPVDAIQEHEYPAGLRFVAIIIALVLSIFLVSWPRFNPGHDCRLTIHAIGFARHGKLLRDRWPRVPLVPGLPSPSA